MIIPKMIKHQRNILILFAIVAGAISVTSLFTPAIVQFTQIIMFVFILFLIPDYIAVKALEARVNIASSARYFVKNEKTEDKPKEKGNRKVLNTPTEVNDIERIK